MLLPTRAHADPDKAIDGLPGSPRPEGVNLSPESPPTPPAPGGRAPSFGAPADPEAWAFRLGGRFSAWGQAGIGHTPDDAPGQSGTTLHTPALVVGRAPFYAGSAATLNFQYGNQTVMGFVSYEAGLTSREWEGYNRTELGPRVRTAYVAITPPPLGDARLRFQFGAFPAHYGAPGQWGWGIFGPVLAVHGYGGTGAVDYTLSPNLVASFEYGVAGVPEVDEGFVRGTYTDWPENGISTIVNHAHLGISYQNKYFAKLHLANAVGRNLRNYLDDDPDTPQVEIGPDGRMTVAALELRTTPDPYGQFGVTPVYWNFDHALSVHDGIWWGLDWTAGGREMTRKYLGPTSEGTGQIFGVSAEYDGSLSRMLHYPAPFDGNGPDLRMGVAFLPHFTLATDDPTHKGANGYFLGATFEHVLLSWLSTTYSMFGESRDETTFDVAGNPQEGKFLAYNATLGLVLHSDWQSRDRLVLAYSRFFYSDFIDNNPERPLDHDVFTLGASLAF
jgi:hypothetical protein